jgi:CHAD domain-containing protein
MLKSPYKIDLGATFSEAAVESLSTQLEELFKNLEGTLDGDVDALHDMRVASRRLRAAMSVFESAFPPKLFRPLEREAARVTDALGEVRDADVQIEYLTKVRDRAAEAEKVGVDALIEHLTAERERHRKELVKEVEKLARSSFRKDFEHMLDAEREAEPVFTKTEGGDNG